MKVILIDKFLQEHVIFENSGHKDANVREAFNWAETYAKKNWNSYTHKKHKGQDRLFTNQYLCDLDSGDCLVFDLI